MCVGGHRVGYRVCVWGADLRSSVDTQSSPSCYDGTDSVTMEEVIGSDSGEGSGLMGDHEDIGSGGGDSYDYDYDFDCGEEGLCLVMQK